MHTDLKARRFHAILKTVLASMVGAQQPHALDGIQLQLGGFSKCVNLKTPVSFIIGDMQGGDKMCGRVMTYGNRSARLCRKCNVQGRHASDVKRKCQRICMDKVRNLILQ